MDLDVHVLTVEAGHFISVHATKEGAMHAAHISGVWHQEDNGFWRCPPYRVTKHKLRVDDMKVRELDSALDDANQQAKRWESEARHFELLWGLANTERNILQTMVDLLWQLDKKKSQLHGVEDDIETMKRQLDAKQVALSETQNTRTAAEDRIPTGSPAD